MKAVNPWLVGSQPKLADLLGVSVRTIDSWRRNGMPGKSGAWDSKEIICWLRTKGAWRPKLPSNDDPLMVGDADSPALERYRLGRAKMVEMDLAEREGKLLDLDVMHMMHSRMAEINRRTGKNLEKEFGKRALEIFNDGFRNAEREADRVYGQSED